MICRHLVDQAASTPINDLEFVSIEPPGFRSSGPVLLAGAGQEQGDPTARLPALWACHADRQTRIARPGFRLAWQAVITDNAKHSWALAIV